MSSQKSALLSCALCALAFPAAAEPTSFYWVENDLSGSPLLGAWRSFDLFVQLEAGDTLDTASWDFSDHKLRTDGAFYNESAGPFESAVKDDAGFSINFGPQISPTYEFDSGVTIDLANALKFFPASRITWDPNGTGGTWFVLRGDEPTSNGVDPFLLARITVSSNTTFLGGEIFVGGTNGTGGDFGATDPETGVFTLRNAIPSPGTFGLFAVAGVFGARRRR